MEKINSIQQLEAEKKRIAHTATELEEKIRRNWTELKHCLQPGHVVSELLAGETRHQQEKPQHPEGILKSTFSYTLNLLAEKLVGIAVDKLDTIIKK